MNSKQLELKDKKETNALYQIKNPNTKIESYVFSSPYSRAICNDSLILGVEYTEKLKQASAHALISLEKTLSFFPKEENTSILHILRGGLNFCIKDALQIACNWNLHSSSFISAQRVVLDATRGDTREDWIIQEDSYQKLVIPDKADIIFGDVVATGRSLEHACGVLKDGITKGKLSINSICFFTIGGVEAERVLEDLDAICREFFTDFKGITVVYFEGQFLVASGDSPVSIKLPGTDLLRRDCILAPEFIESQYEKSHYPLERCAIYDAGSRAFSPRKYLEDVREYWEQCSALCNNKYTFEDLLKERMPDIDVTKFTQNNLKEVVDNRLAQVDSIFGQS